MDKHGLEVALADDEALLLKLSLLATYYDNIRHLYDATSVPLEKAIWYEPYTDFAQ